MSRTIHSDEIAQAVERLARDAAFEIDDRLRELLKDAASREESELGRQVFTDLLKNAEVAASERRPLCQDTGFAIVWVEIGTEVVVAGSLRAAVDEGVRRAWKAEYLRASVVAHPLRRTNTGDNTPVALHVEEVTGEGLHIRFLAKGGGSENQTRLGMLKPSQGRAGVLDFVERAAKDMAAYACPPVILGIGIGGTADIACWLGKKALFRPLGEPSGDLDDAALEVELLARANSTGIGPMGLGGRVTALAAAVECAPCHMACLPVCVTINCHSHRVRSVVL